ncbi:MAG: WG repeat-containing protein [Candidatus Obscuribacterales bacterium]|nr:WG repeat-containing protein [Candidatus Obscuribacterales bacterium]
METEFAALPFVIVASLVSVFLTFLFVLPTLPGITFPKTLGNIALAFLTAVAQTVSTTLFLFCIGYPALYMGIWIGLGGGAASYPLWFGAALALLLTISSGFAFLYLFADTLLSRKSINFSGGFSLPLGALVLTFVQVAIGGAIFYTAELRKPTDKFGYIDKTGKFVIPAKYEHAENFRQGYAKVTLPKGLDGQLKEPIYINHSGATIIPPVEVSRYAAPIPKLKMDDIPEIYEDAGSNSTGRYFIDIKGLKFLPFSEDLAAAQHNENLLWGFVNRKYNLVIPASFDDVRSFKEGLAAVKATPEKDKSLDDLNPPKFWGFIDHKGHWVVKPKFLSAESFSDGLACVTVAAPTTWDQNGTKTGYINKKGDFVIPPNFQWGQSFSEGVAAAAVKIR